MSKYYNESEFLHVNTLDDIPHDYVPTPKYYDKVVTANGSRYLMGASGFKYGKKSLIIGVLHADEEMEENEKEDRRIRN
jgi:hypothetical protein